MIYIGFFASLLILGFVVGSIIEKKHFQNLKQREQDLNSIPWSNRGKKDNYSDYSDSKFVTGSVVVAQDYFKSFVAGLINLTGGRVTSYESLLDRGRREALCRLREEAKAWGGDSVVNIRFETSTIGMNKGGDTLGSIEVFAYGTALKNK